jgi:hypothetical protein
MFVRCSYCRHTFTLSRDYVAKLLSEAEERGQKYHTVECLNCRKQIKVPVDQLRRSAPESERAAEE